MQKMTARFGMRRSLGARAEVVAPPSARRIAGRTVVGLGLLASFVVAVHTLSGGYPLAFDAHAYWAINLADPYRATQLGTPDAYWYSPAFAQLTAPLRLLPWPVFFALWFAAAAVCLVWLSAGRRKYLVYFLAFPPIVSELLQGNVHIFYAVAIVIGFRYPAAWALMLLTKITPGVGLVWFAVRREWRQLGAVLGVTALIAIASALLAPALWPDWVRAILGARLRGDELLPFPLVVRAPAAALIVAWGGLTDRRWTLPVAVWLAIPSLWFTTPAVLAALPRVLSPRTQT